MSRRSNIQLSSDEQATFLREHHKAALATIHQDGFPHVVGMNFFVKDGAFYMTSYGKAQKVVNIRRNSRVALMVETGSGYAELRGVMIRGRCEIIDDVEALKAAFASASERKWVPGTFLAYSSGSAPTRAAMILMASSRVAGSLM